MIKKYVLFISLIALVASVSLARLESKLDPKTDPALRMGGTSTPSFADQVANFVAIAASLNSGGPGTTSLDPASNEVSKDGAHIELTGNTKPTSTDNSEGDTDNTEI